MSVSLLYTKINDSWRSSVAVFEALFSGLARKSASNCKPACFYRLASCMHACGALI